MDISFNISDDLRSQLFEYSDDEINCLAKHCFISFLKKERNDTIQLSDLGKQINDGLEPTINKLFGISKSTEKGKIYENVIETTIQEHFPNYKYENTASTNHVGDGLLITSNGTRCIIEAKNYTTMVPKSQIEKLKSDMISTGINNAIMLSTGPIQGKKFVDIENDTMGNIVYISNYFDSDPQLQLQMAITIMSNLALVQSTNIERKIDNLNATIEHVSKLKIDYIAMEKSIRTNLDTFYISLREYEMNVKTEIHNIMVSLPLSNQKLINSILDSKLDRVYSDIIKPLRLHIIEQNGIFVYMKKRPLANIKVMKKQLQVSFVDINCKFNITDENMARTMNLFKVLLEGYIKGNSLIL